MQITDILKSLKTQTFIILQEEKCSQVLFCNMLKTYFLVTKQLDVLHSWNLIKSFQILLVLLVMSILTSSAYKYISLALLVTCFSLICYIITFEFIRLKGLYEDLRISCHLQEENPPPSLSSSNWCISRSSKHLSYLLGKHLGYRVSHKKRQWCQIGLTLSPCALHIKSCMSVAHWKTFNVQ